MQQVSRWRSAVAIAAATVTTLGLVSCTSSGAPEGPVDSATIVIPAEPASLDGCDIQIIDTGYVLIGNVVEALTAIDPVSGETVGQLAESWTQDSDTTWTFHLRDGVTFSNGEPFNAQAAKFNIDRLVNASSDETKTCSALSNWAGETVDVEVVDDHTIRITTSVVDPVLPTRLVWTAMMAPSVTPPAAKTNQTVGTGPYTIAEYVPTERIVMQRNESYWGEAPALASATWLWRETPSVRADMVRTGEADIAINLSPQDVLNEPNVQTFTLNSVAFIRLDTDIPPLNDVRVREAIARSIDRETIVETLMGGGVGEVSYQFVSELINGYVPNFEGVTYDPERAKALVEEARADGVPVDTVIPLYDRGDLYAGQGEVLQAVVSDINKSGLNVQLMNVDAEAWRAQNARPFPADRPARIQSSLTNNNTGDAAFNFLTYMVPGGRHNVVDDPTLADLIARANASPLGPQRDQLFQQAARRVYADLFYLVPIAYVNGLLTTSDRISYTADALTGVSIQVANITPAS